MRTPYIRKGGAETVLPQAVTLIRARLEDHMSEGLTHVLRWMAARDSMGGGRAHGWNQNPRAVETNLQKLQAVWESGHRDITVYGEGEERRFRLWSVDDGFVYFEADFRLRGSVHFAGEVCKTLTGAGFAIHEVETACPYMIIEGEDCLRYCFGDSHESAVRGETYAGKAKEILKALGMEA